MEITEIRVYQVDLPLVDGSYKWAGGKEVKVFDGTVVEVEAKAANGDIVIGVGEVTPLGPFYLPAYADGARNGIKELAPHVMGLDPTQIAVVNSVMDAALLGHPYVKSPIDMACWDILGKVTKQPVCVLLGGRFGDEIKLYRPITQGTPDEMRQTVNRFREEGYTKFQLKVGGRDVSRDIDCIKACCSILTSENTLVADANCGWLPHEAQRVLHGVTDCDVYIEQPCKTYEECLMIRRNCQHPFVLDENIDGLSALLRAHKDGACDAINLKISKVGGLTKARQIRDLAVHLGLAMTVEDTWGGDVTTAAIAHLAQSTPEAFRYAATDFNSSVTVSFADGAPQRTPTGTMRASNEPGLGVSLKHDVLGEPIAIYRKA